MKIITKYNGKTRNELMARTTYHAVLEISVSDLETEDGVDFDQWIIDNFPYIPFEVMMAGTGRKLPECDCDC